MVDWTTIGVQFLVTLPAMLMALATLITALRTRSKTDELAVSVNGHMTNLLEKTEIVAKAIGKQEGKAEEQVKESLPVRTSKRATDK